MMEQIKKYIRGNKERGSDVIAELEKLGGKNTLKLKGEEYDKVYYIARYKYSEPNTIDIVREKSFIGQLIVTHPEWEEIELPKIFKDGDVVAATITSGIWIGIFKQYKAMLFESYCSLSTAGEFHSKGFKNHRLRVLRLATEEEKEKLFKAIKDNGYKWNAETKTLEKLIIPKFKVGDRVKHKESYISGVVTEIDSEYYKVKYDSGAVNFANIKYQDDWELVPNKFDISTLVPFESRVLVRDYNGNIWKPAIYGFTYSDKYYVVGGIYWKQCIPYDVNKELLGTEDDCPDFYKTWEE